MVLLTLTSAYPGKQSSFHPLSLGSETAVRLPWQSGREYIWSFAYNGKEMNISLQKEKKNQLQWTVWGCLLSPLASSFNSDAGGPSRPLQRMQGGGALEARLMPCCANAMLCDFEWVTDPVWFPLPWPHEPRLPQQSVLRMNVWPLLVLAWEVWNARECISVCLSPPQTTKDFELLWERGCVNAAQLQQSSLPPRCWPGCQVGLWSSWGWSSGVPRWPIVSLDSQGGISQLAKELGSTGIFSSGHLAGNLAELDGYCLISSWDGLKLHSRGSHTLVLIRTTWGTC